nr:MFS transporter [Nanchangia anserum]
MFGIPKKLLLGYVALAIFMAGDGFDLTFLSHFLVVEQGFAPTSAGAVFTVYGLLAGFSAWTTGVLAERYGAKRLMLIGGVSWIILHIIFLTIGLGSPLAAILTYGLRGLSYPLFMYSFVVLIATSVPPARLASAMGWFWTAFSFGLGTLGAYLPSLTVPQIGELGTLWLSPVFVAAGTILCAIGVPSHTRPSADEGEDNIRELLRGVTILVENPQIARAVVIRVLCNITMYGFPMLMPLYLTGKIADSREWYTQEEWMRAWALMSAICLVANVVWGRLGDKFGWMRQMRWFGFGGMILATLAFGYGPRLSEGSDLALLGAAVLFGCSVTAFVPMGAIFPALAPNHPGAAISAHNLASGLTTFIGPGIATVLLPLIGPQGVLWTYCGLFLLGFALTFIIRPYQPGITDETGRSLPRAERANARA